MPLETLGDYGLVERLHTGPRAEVWAAEGRDGQKVAIKVVLDGVARRPGFVTRFEKETSALLLMNHPNVLPCRARGVSGGRYYVVQPLLPKSLRAELRAGSMAPRAAVAVAADACSALDYAHRRAVAHRHVVAENVFLDPQSGSSRVGDFGWSLLDGPAPAEATTDVRSDLHQLAVLLYEALSGKAPSSPAAPLAGRIEGVDARFDAFFATALGADASRRFRRASEMSLALSLLLPKAAAPEAPAPDLATAVVTGATARVRLRTGVTPAALQGAQQEVERAMTSALPRGGEKWAVAYDLMELSIMEDPIQDAIFGFVMRRRPWLGRVAFASPRAMVRAGALVVAQRAGVPSQFFASLAPMNGWLGGGAS